VAVAAAAAAGHVAIAIVPRGGEDGSWWAHVIIVVVVVMVGIAGAGKVLRGKIHGDFLTCFVECTEPPPSKHT